MFGGIYPSSVMLERRRRIDEHKKCIRKKAARLDGLLLHSEAHKYRQKIQLVAEKHAEIYRQKEEALKGIEQATDEIIDRAVKRATAECEPDFDPCFWERLKFWK